jgi:predicted transposase/invertase (TIGR01784 family)
MSKVNPKIDLVFKKLFGSEENKDILLSLVNAILPATQQVATLTLKNPYNVSDYAEGKLSILDIKAEGEDGKLFDVEMQIRGSDFYGRRTLFYWAKMFGSQLDYINAFATANEQLTETEKLAALEKQGKLGYSGLKKCLVISLIDFTFFDDPRYHRLYTLQDGDTHETHKDLDYLDLYFIELKKYKGQLQQLNTTLERWITFLNTAYQYDNKTLPKELATIKEIHKASQKLDTMYLDEKEKGYYEAQQKFWLDQNTFIKETVEKEVKKGIEKALKAEVEKAVGKAEMNKKTEIAKNAIRKGLDNEFISELTGLTVEQIDALRNER